MDILGHFPRRQATALRVACTYLFLETLLAAIDLAGCGRSALELRRFASAANVALVGVLCCIGSYRMVVDPGNDDDHRREWATQSWERAARGGWSDVDGLGIVTFAFFADALRKPTFDSVFIRCEDGEARNAARPLVGRLGDLCSFFVRDTPLLVEN